jgi:hypothetical protein
MMPYADPEKRRKIVREAMARRYRDDPEYRERQKKSSRERMREIRSANLQKAEKP